MVLRSVTAGLALSNHPINEAIYWVFRYLPHFIIPIMLIVIGLSFVRGGVSPKHRNPWLFLLLVLLIGPGLLVHSVFKEGFQRERPRAVEQFGGSDAFTPAFVINQEGNGKSFVSGHSAMAFYLWRCMDISSSQLVVLGHCFRCDDECCAHHAGRALFK